MPLKGLLLDIDNTLYSYDPAHRAGLAAAFGYLRAHTSLDLEPHFKAARRQVNERLAETAASHNRMLYFQGMCERLGLNSMRHAHKAYAAYWDAFLDAMRLDEGVLDLLKAHDHLPVCLVTDLTAHIQFRKVERLGLAEFADFMVTSEEAGREKPDARMFGLALEKLGLAPDETCMVGDSYEKDALGAARAGIPAYWLNREAGARDLTPGITEIRSMRELGAYLHA